jgi:two-component system, LytTR family, response regulator
MDKLRVIIVDDEQDCREVLHQLLIRNCDEVEIIGEASNVEDAFELINKEKPNLVFLDIQMPRADGFSLLKKFREVFFSVIFVTSHEEYAISAIRFSALDYLLKPLNIDDLKDAVQRAYNNKATSLELQPQIINLLHQLNGDPIDSRIAIHDGGKVKLISEKNILFIEADGRYSKICMSSGEHYITARNLKEFEDYFGALSSFVRINKTHLVNALHIKEYTKGEPFILIMQNETIFEVSRRKKPEVLEKLKK